MLLFRRWVDFAVLGRDLAGVVRGRSTGGSGSTGGKSGSRLGMRTGEFSCRTAGGGESEEEGDGRDGSGKDSEAPAT